MRNWMRTAASRAFFSLHRPRGVVRVIFFYHSVGSGSPLAQPAAAFRAQVQYLARWFRVVRLAEFLSAAEQVTDRHLACLTFDDGYADNATIVRDILDAAGIPGTFFVVTGALGHDFHTSGGVFRLMTPAQVQSLARAGHEIGAHTVSHPQLTDVQDADARREVSESKRYLEDLLGTAVSSFAYPKGRINARVREFVVESGYRQAVVTRRAFVGRHVDRFALPRMAVRDYIRQSIWRPAS